MRFAQWVLKQIADDGGKLIFSEYCSMGGHYKYVNPGREMWSAKSHNSLHYDNEWDLFVSGWIFKSAVLIRGRHRETIKLTRKEKKVFIKLHKEYVESQREIERGRKEAARLRNVRAQEF